MDRIKHHHSPEDKLCCDCGLGMAVSCPHRYERIMAKTWDERLNKYCDIDVFLPKRLPMVSPEFQPHQEPLF